MFRIGTPNRNDVAVFRILPNNPYFISIADERCFTARTLRGGVAINLVVIYRHSAN